MANLGIDFGSSYTTVAWVNPHDGKPEAVKFNGDGSVKFPSLILGSDNGLILGFTALNYLDDIYRLQEEEKFRMLANFIPSIKRVLNPDTRETLGNKEYTHLQLLTAMFEHLLGQVAEHCGQKVHFDTVSFSYPVDFAEAKKGLIRKAFENNGVGIKSTNFEPVAAVKGYKIDHKIEENEGLLVFDFGGGTVDVAYVSNKYSELNVACEPRGNSFCGGQDIDYLVYEDLQKKILDKYQYDISVNGFVDYSILNMCRRLKEYFSGPNNYYETQIGLVVNGSFENYKYGLNRDAFNNIIYPKVNEAVFIAQQVVDEAKSKSLPIDKVLLIGGSSKLTLVKDMLHELLPDAAIETCGERDIAVALGNLVVQEEVSPPTDIDVDWEKSITCKKCHSKECYRIKGRPEYHCFNCGWEGLNVIVLY